MTNRYFDQATAPGKVGARIQTLVQFSGVPQGTFGEVINFDLAVNRSHQADPTEGGYTLVIQWELPGRTKPLVDWFSREEYARFLREV
jgi:hypothetical protein